MCKEIKSSTQLLVMLVIFKANNNIIFLKGKIFATTLVVRKHGMDSDLKSNSSFVCVVCWWMASYFLDWLFNVLSNPPLSNLMLQFLHLPGCLSMPFFFSVRGVQ